jgi:hypothetical protein
MWGAMTLVLDAETDIVLQGSFSYEDSWVGENCDAYNLYLIATPG